MLRIENLTFSYPRKNVLSNFSLTMPPGKIYGLLGPNGAGKSTLLYLIAGLLTPKAGHITFKNADTRLRLPSTLNDIFIVPEEFTLPPITLTDYARVNSVYYPRFSHDDMALHLATFELDPNVKMNELSMGQKKKAFMCFALACNTSLLLMDEPTNGLDIPGKSRFRKFIVSAMTDDRTIIISTHQVRDIDKILDHVVITDQSSVILDSDVDGITSRLKFVTTRDLTPIEGTLFSQPTVEGINLVLPNNDGYETTLNLESLFELTLARPELIKSIFNMPPLPSTPTQQ